MSTNAVLDIKIGVQVHQRIDAERFRRTNTWISPYHFVTDFTNVAAMLPGIADSVWTDVSSARAATGVYHVDLHLAIRVDNPTHPVPAKGVVPLAKAHKDTIMTQGEVVNANSILVALQKLVDDVLALSQYA